MPKILVIDHDPETREMYREALVAEGFEVATVSDPTDAMRLVLDWDPQLAVLDVRLGDGSGLDLLRHLVEARPSLCTILVSAYPGYRDDFTAWLADAFLNKTRDVTELMSKIHELLAASPAG